MHRELIRPSISFSADADKQLRVALAGVATGRHLAALLRLAAASREPIMQRMALNHALSIAARERPVATARRVLRLRCAAGFAGVTDAIYSLQSLIDASRRREELRPPARRAVALMEGLIVDDGSLASGNARTFVAATRGWL